MTLIAAILPLGGPPFFLSDVLISSNRVDVGRMAAPSGLIQRPAEGATAAPLALEQKCLIISNRIWAAYCGDVIAGKTALSRLRQALSGSSDPLPAFETMQAELGQDLAENKSSMLIGIIGLENSLHTRFLGAGTPLETTLSNGTVLIADGSGRDIFVEIVSPIIEASRGVNPTYDVLALLSEISTRETIHSGYPEHFGGLIEVTGATQLGFEKLPSLTIATEVASIHGDTAALPGGNYLNYHYIDDILVYRRFGNIRGDEMFEAFGTDYIVGAVYPPGRRRKSEENEAVCRQIVSNPTFNDSVLQVISWNVPEDITARRLFIGTPDHSQYRVERVDDTNFVVFRSHAFLDHIAKRLGARSIVSPS